MKKLIILFVTFISICNLFSQNTIDPPKLQNYTNTDVFDRTFGETNFIKGWNWGSPGRRLDEALNMNYYHRGYRPDWNDQNSLTSGNLFIPNHRQIMQLPWLVAGYGSSNIFNSQAIILSPLLNVDSTNNFVPMPYDSSGHVFGFCDKNKIRILSSSLHDNPNYYFGLLDKDWSAPTFSDI